MLAAAGAGADGVLVPKEKLEAALGVPKPPPGADAPNWNGVDDAVSGLGADEKENPALAGAAGLEASLEPKAKGLGGSAGLGALLLEPKANGEGVSLAVDAPLPKGEGFAVPPPVLELPNANTDPLLELVALDPKAKAEVVVGGGC